MSDLEEVMKAIGELDSTATVADVISYLEDKFKERDSGEGFFEPPRSHDEPEE